MPLDIMDRDWKLCREILGISRFRSLAEIASAFRFVKPENNDPRYLVAQKLKAYLIKHKLIIDLSQELGWVFGGRRKLQDLGYEGENYPRCGADSVKRESWAEF